MLVNPPVVVLVTGAGPYLGGPATWKPLRDAAPEFAFRDVDLMASGGRIDAVRDMLRAALHDADAIVAHGTAAGTVLDLVAAEQRSMPALLLSPLVVFRATPALHALRAFLRVGGASLITAAARKKLVRLRVSRDAVAEELRGLVCPDRLSDALVDEACARIADPRTASVVERTGDVLRAVTRPVSSDAAGVRRIVLASDDELGRKLARRMQVRLLQGSRSAVMIDDPRAVREALHELLGAA